MRLSRHNLTLHTAARKGSDRPAIEMILCEREGTVSVDGFRLTFVPYPDGPAAQDDPAVGALIPVEAADRAAASTRATDEILVTRSDDLHVAVTARSTNGGGSRVEVIARRPDAQYPVWREIVPTTFAVDVALNPTYLVDALETLRQLGCTIVRLRMNSPTTPVLLEGYGGEVGAERPAFVLVMPMHHERPAQENSG